MAGLVISACSEEKAADTGAVRYQAIPEGMTFVAEIDVQSALGFAKTLRAAMPKEAQANVPPMDEGIELLQTTMGVDVSKMKQIVIAGKLEDKDPSTNMIGVIQGMTAESLKGGTKFKEIEGKQVFTFGPGSEKVYLASLDANHTVFAAQEAGIASALAAHAGKAKRLLDGGKKDLLGKLMGTSPDLKTLRVHVLGMPPGEKTPFTVNGGGFYLDMDKGIAGIVVSEAAGADMIKTQADMGMAMAGTQLGQIPGLTPEAKKTAEALVKGIKIEKDGDTVIITCTDGWDGKAIAQAIAGAAAPAMAEFGGQMKAVTAMMAAASAAAPAEAKPAEGKPAEGEAKPEDGKPAEAKPAAVEEMFGLKLKPLGKWKPAWDADAKIARWENPKFAKPVEVYMLVEKIADFKELKGKGESLVFLGTKINKIAKKKKTKNGFWAEVRRKKEKDLVFVQNFGDQQFACVASLTKAKGKKGMPIKRKMALKLCNGIQKP